MHVSGILKYSPRLKALDSGIIELCLLKSGLRLLFLSSALEVTRTQEHFDNCAAYISHRFPAFVHFPLCNTTSTKDAAQTRNIRNVIGELPLRKFGKLVDIYTIMEKYNIIYIVSTWEGTQSAEELKKLPIRTAQFYCG